jgi:uncharacterized protein YecT (DUF1311 family)
MTKALFSVLLCLFSLAAIADEELDPRVVAAAVVQMKLPADKVRELALHGCDSGAPPDRRGCATYWFISEDLAMNDLLKQLMADRQGKPQQKLLQDSQRAWLAYRDASCEFEAAGNLGGALAPVDALQCRKTATELRNAQLRTYGACTADGGCP